MKKHDIILAILLCALIPSLSQSEEKAALDSLPVRHVILISIDGLRADAITALGPKGAPALHYLMESGVSTLNARTDPDFVNTLPNHTSMVTGLAVHGPQGHNYVTNDVDKKNIHDIKGRYVHSIFDVVHEQGLRSALFSGKRKFMLFVKSYGGKGIYFGKDYSTDKRQLIDVYKISNYNDHAILDVFLQELGKNPPNFTLLHLVGPDNVGHSFQWDVSPGSIYLKEVQRVDQLVGNIVKTIQDQPQLARSTALIVTTDHGGHGDNHDNPQYPNDFTIPFIVCGQGVAKGKDLY